MQQEAQADELQQGAVLVERAEVEDDFVAVAGVGPVAFAVAFEGRDDALKLLPQGCDGFSGRVVDRQSLEAIPGDATRGDQPSFFDGGPRACWPAFKHREDRLEVLFELPICGFIEKLLTADHGFPSLSLSCVNGWFQRGAARASSTRSMSASRHSRVSLCSECEPCPTFCSAPTRINASACDMACGIEKNIT